MALPDGTGASKPACCTPISTQWPNCKMLGFERLSTSHKSASNITYSANVSRRCSARVLRTVKHAIRAYSLVRTVQHAISANSLVWPLAVCSVFSMPWCFTIPHHLHNTNTRCLQLLEYRDASSVVKLWVVVKRCHTSCTPCTMHVIVRVALSHCVYSQLCWWISTHYTINLSVPALARFLGTYLYV